MEKDDNKMVDLYYDHYKDTFQQLEGYLTKRDRLTMVLFISITIILFFLSNPISASQFANNYLSNFIKDVNVDFNYLNTCALYYLLWIVLQYYHVNIHIERMYSYIHSKEDMFNSLGIEIDREGRYYKEHNTMFAKFVKYIYIWGVPIFLMILSIYKIHNEIIENFPLKWWDFIALSLIILLSILYSGARLLKV